MALIEDIKIFDIKKKYIVIPAKAGIQANAGLDPLVKPEDDRLRNWRVDIIIKRN